VYYRIYVLICQGAIFSHHGDFTAEGNLPQRSQRARRRAFFRAEFIAEVAGSAEKSTLGRQNLPQNAMGGGMLPERSVLCGVKDLYLGYVGFTPKNRHQVMEELEPRRQEGREGGRSDGDHRNEEGRERRGRTGGEGPLERGKFCYLTIRKCCRIMSLLSMRDRLRENHPQWVAAIFLTVDDNQEDCHAITG
jgi:hypothetical protein